MRTLTPADDVQPAAVTHAHALAVTLARIAVELDLLGLDVAQVPDAVVDDLLFEMAWHHACQALEALDNAVPIRVADLRVAA